MIHIACAADTGFIPHCAAMIHSVLSRHSAGEVTIHFVHDGDVAAVDIDRLVEFVRSCGGQCQTHEITAENRARCPQNRRFGQVAWYRVMLPDLVPGLDRILYLDADTIVLRPLSPLWNTDLQGRLLGAVGNPLYPFMDKSFLTRLGLRPESYFNSGVLLLDLKHWREKDIGGQVLSLAARQGAQEWPDQNALNVVFRDTWLPLAPEWNAQNTVFDLPIGELPFQPEEVKSARRDPAVIHYIGPYKPWHYRCKHALRYLYWQHLEHTPWNQSGMTGVTFANRLLRPLPEQWGWQVDTLIRRVRS